MTGPGDWLSLAKPILSLVADLITAIDEQKAGRNGSADFIRSGSDLISAVGQTRSALTKATSGAKYPVPASTATQNISGWWLNSEANIYACHDEITGLLLLKDGDYEFVGGAQPIEDFLQFIVTGQSSDGVNLLWHGVVGSRYVVSTLWNWDNKDTVDVRFERQGWPY